VVAAAAAAVVVVVAVGCVSCTHKYKSVNVFECCTRARKRK
jgi:hypothetical protein